VSHIKSDTHHGQIHWAHYFAFKETAEKVKNK
jgi:hypothetical protein